MPVKKIILKNSIRCKLCNDEIESKTTHDFRSCKCGEVSVDGGTSYSRWIGDPENIIDTSVYKIVDKNSNFK